MKQFRKRMIATGLTVTVTLSSAGNLQVFANEKTPIDVEKGYFAEKYIDKFIEKGILEGYPDGTFKPNNDITRAEFIKIVNKAFGFTEKGTENFSDVNSGDWFYDEVLIAVKKGYIDGYPDGTFKPNEKITREESAKILGTILNLKGDLNTKFIDDSKIATWAKEYIDGLVDNGVINGYEDNTFRPKNNATRGEASKLVAESTLLDSNTSNDIVIDNNNTPGNGTTTDGTVDNSTGSTTTGGTTTDGTVDNSTGSTTTGGTTTDGTVDTSPATVVVNITTGETISQDSINEAFENNQEAEVVELKGEEIKIEDLTIPEGKTLKIESTTNAVITGDISVGTGKLEINSGAVIEGNIDATEGKLEINGDVKLSEKAVLKLYDETSIVSKYSTINDFETKVVGNGKIIVGTGTILLKDLMQIDVDIEVCKDSKLKKYDLWLVNKEVEDALITINTNDTTVLFDYQKDPNKRDLMTVYGDVTFNDTFRDFPVKSGQENARLRLPKNVEVSVFDGRDIDENKFTNVKGGTYKGQNDGKWKKDDRIVKVETALTTGDTLDGQVEIYSIGVSNDISKARYDKETTIEVKNLEKNEFDLDLTKEVQFVVNLGINKDLAGIKLNGNIIRLEGNKVSKKIEQGDIVTVTIRQHEFERLGLNSNGQTLKIEAVEKDAKPSEGIVITNQILSPNELVDSTTGGSVSKVTTYGTVTTMATTSTDTTVKVTVDNKEVDHLKIEDMTTNPTIKIDINVGKENTLKDVILHGSSLANLPKDLGQGVGVSIALTKDQLIDLIWAECKYDAFEIKVVQEGNKTSNTTDSTVTTGSTVTTEPTAKPEIVIEDVTDEIRNELLTTTQDTVLVSTGKTVKVSSLEIPEGKTLRVDGKLIVNGKLDVSEGNLIVDGEISLSETGELTTNKDSITSLFDLVEKYPSLTGNGKIVINNGTLTLKSTIGVSLDIEASRNSKFKVNEAWLIDSSKGKKALLTLEDDDTVLTFDYNYDSKDDKEKNFDYLTVDGYATFNDGYGGLIVKSKGNSKLRIEDEALYVSLYDPTDKENHTKTVYGGIFKGKNDGSWTKSQRDITVTTTMTVTTDASLEGDVKVHSIGVSEDTTKSRYDHDTTLKLKTDKTFDLDLTDEVQFEINLGINRELAGIKVNGTIIKIDADSISEEINQGDIVTVTLRQNDLTRLGITSHGQELNFEAIDRKASKDSEGIAISKEILSETISSDKTTTYGTVTTMSTMSTTTSTSIDVYVDNTTVDTLKIENMSTNPTIRIDVLPGKENTLRQIVLHGSVLAELPSNLSKGQGVSIELTKDELIDLIRAECKYDAFEIKVVQDTSTTTTTPGTTTGSTTTSPTVDTTDSTVTTGPSVTTPGTTTPDTTTKPSIDTTDSTVDTTKSTVEIVGKEGQDVTSLVLASLYTNDVVKIKGDCNIDSELYIPVEGKTLIIEGNVNLNNDLDVSKGNLILNGTLTMDEGSSLTTIDNTTMAKYKTIKDNLKQIDGTGKIVVGDNATVSLRDTQGLDIDIEVSKESKLRIDNSWIVNRRPGSGTAVVSINSDTTKLTYNFGEEEDYAEVIGDITVNGNHNLAYLKATQDAKLKVSNGASVNIYDKNTTGSSITADAGSYVGKSDGTWTKLNGGNTTSGTTTGSTTTSPTVDTTDSTVTTGPSVTTPGITTPNTTTSSSTTPATLSERITKEFETKDIVSIDGDLSLEELTIPKGKTLEVQGKLLVNNRLRVEGDLQVEGKVELSEGAVLSADNGKLARSKEIANLKGNGQLLTSGGTLELDSFDGVELQLVANRTSKIKIGDAWLLNSDLKEGPVLTINDDKTTITCDFRYDEDSNKIEENKDYLTVDGDISLNDTYRNFIIKATENARLNVPRNSYADLYSLDKSVDGIVSVYGGSYTGRADGSWTKTKKDINITTTMSSVSTTGTTMIGDIDIAAIGVSNDTSKQRYNHETSVKVNGSDKFDLDLTKEVQFEVNLGINRELVGIKLNGNIIRLDGDRVSKKIEQGDIVTVSLRQDDFEKLGLHSDGQTLNIEAIDKEASKKSEGIDIAKKIIGSNSTTSSATTSSSTASKTTTYGTITTTATTVTTDTTIDVLVDGEKVDKLKIEDMTTNSTVKIVVNTGKDNTIKEIVLHGSSLSELPTNLTTGQGVVVELTKDEVMDLIWAECRYDAFEIKVIQDGYTKEETTNVTTGTTVETTTEATLVDKTTEIVSALTTQDTVVISTDETVKVSELTVPKGKTLEVKGNLVVTGKLDVTKGNLKVDGQIKLSDDAIFTSNETDDESIKQNISGDGKIVANKGTIILRGFEGISANLEFNNDSTFKIGEVLLLGKQVKSVITINDKNTVLNVDFTDTEDYLTVDGDITINDIYRLFTIKSANENSLLRLQGRASADLYDGENQIKNVVSGIYKGTQDGKWVKGDKEISITTTTSTTSEGTLYGDVSIAGSIGVSNDTTKDRYSYNTSVKVNGLNNGKFDLDLTKEVQIVVNLGIDKNISAIKLNGNVIKLDKASQAITKGDIITVTLRQEDYAKLGLNSNGQILNVEAIDYKDSSEIEGIKIDTTISNNTSSSTTSGSSIKTTTYGTITTTSSTTNATDTTVDVYVGNEKVEKFNIETMNDDENVKIEIKLGANKTLKNVSLNGNDLAKLQEENISSGSTVIIELTKDELIDLIWAECKYDEFKINIIEE